MRVILILKIIALVVFLTGCEEGSDSPSTIVAAVSCRGVYYERDSLGTLRKFNEYYQADQKTCLIDNLKLSHYEEGQELWRKRNVSCSPQPGFASRSLVAENNYYEYRNQKAYLQFDSSTGIFRRIILAESENGDPYFTKLQGCFFQRTATGIDAHHGKQILLDTQIDKLISSQFFDGMEIFTYTESGNELNMLRFDETNDYNYTFCPTLRTEWRYCQKLRDGNSMYWPLLPLADQVALTQEAIIISRQYNWITVSDATFNDLWDNVRKSRTEAMREDYKFEVIHVPDVPRLIDAAWRSFLMGTRPKMPDTSSSQMIPICFSSSKSITYSDGSTGRIYGEACYQSDGTYSFTPN